MRIRQGNYSQTEQVTHRPLPRCIGCILQPPEVWILSLGALIVGSVIAGCAIMYCIIRCIRWKKYKKSVSPVFCEKAEVDQNENHIVDRSNSSEQNLLYCTPDEITTCRTQTDVVKENTLKDLAGYVFAEPVQQSNAAVSVVKNNETKFTTSTESSDDKIKDISHVQRRICRKIAEVPAIYSEVKETTESNIDETDDQKKEIKHNILSSIRGYKETKYLLERNSCRGRRLTCDLDNCHLPLKTSSAKGDSDNDDNDETQDDLKKNMKISRTKASKNKQPEFIKKEHVYCDIIEDELDKESKKGRKRFQIPEFSAYQKQNLADKSGGSKSSSQIRQTKDIDPEDLPSEYPANDELHTSSEDGAYETVTPTAPGHVLKGMTLYSDVLLKGNPEGERKLPKTRTFREIKSPSRVVPVQRPKSHLIKPALL